MGSDVAHGDVIWKSETCGRHLWMEVHTKKGSFMQNSMFTEGGSGCNSLRKTLHYSSHAHLQVMRIIHVVLSHQSPSCAQQGDKCRVRHTPINVYRLECLLFSTVNSFGSSFTAWSVFSWHCWGSLNPSERKINANKFKAILSDHVRPMDERFIQG